MHTLAVSNVNLIHSSLLAGCMHFGCQSHLISTHRGHYGGFAADVSARRHLHHCEFVVDHL